METGENFFSIEVYLNNLFSGGLQERILVLQARLSSSSSKNKEDCDASYKSQEQRYSNLASSFVPLTIASACLLS